MKKILLVAALLMTSNAQAKNKVDKQFEGVIGYSYNRCMSIYYGDYGKTSTPASRDFHLNALSYFEISNLMVEWEKFDEAIYQYVVQHPREINDSEDEHHKTVWVSKGCDIFSKSDTIKNLYLTLPRL